MPGKMANEVDDNMLNESQTGQPLQHGAPEEENGVDSSNEKDPTPSANTKKRQEKQMLVQKLIHEVKDHGATVLELNDMDISEIPEEMLELTNLQVL